MKLTKNNIKLLTQNPSLLFKKIKNVGKNANSSMSETVVGKTISERILEIKKNKYKHIAVFGNSQFFEQIKKHLDKKKYLWISENYSEQLEGAAHPNELLKSNFDAILTGGDNVAGQYLLSLKHFEKKPEKLIPILWVSEKFEFCHGSVSFPNNIDDANIYLFNHFEIFFGIKDNLLIKIEAFDEIQEKTFFRLIKPNETLRLNLNQLLINRKGASAVTVYVEHPNLTKGRHYRWRFFVDVFKDKSISALHGAHDMRGSDSMTSFRVSKSLHEKSEITLTLPNFFKDIKDPIVNCINGDDKRVYKRKNSNRIEEISFETSLDSFDKETPTSKNLCGCDYNGYGGSFWYAQAKSAEGHINLSSNHSVGWPYPVYPKEKSFSETPYFQKLKKDGYVFWPYAVPVTKSETSIEYGISFNETYPNVKNLRVLFFDKTGKYISEIEHEIKSQSPLYTDEIFLNLPKKLQQASLTIFAPCIEEVMVAHPKKWRANVNFLARLRRNRDFDMTEFQSSWRNIGTNIKEFPHWIAPPMSYLGRSNLYGRAISNPTTKTGLLLVNASGYLEYNSTADINISLFNKSKLVANVDLELKAFNYGFYWLDELFKNIADDLGNNGFGAVIIQSKNADLNAQMVTLHENTGISLQHLWGY